jgi:uncharacterized protein
MAKALPLRGIQNMMDEEILNKALRLICSDYKDLYENSVIEEVRCGPFLCMVKLSSTFCGLSGTELPAANAGTEIQRFTGAFSPGYIAGSKLPALMEFQEPHPLLLSLKTAAINALSSEIAAKSGKYKILHDCDPVSLLPDSGPSLHVCVVGAFRSYLKLFSAGPHRLSLLELRPEVVPEEYRNYLVPASEAAAVLHSCDVLVITGATLLNSTLEELLRQTKAGCRRILVGPTAGLLPEVFFSMGIHICGTTRINDSVRVMRAVSEGAFGYHLFGNGAEKISILNES